MIFFLTNPKISPEKEQGKPPPKKRKRGPRLTLPKKRKPEETMNTIIKSYFPTILNCLLLIGIR